MVPVTCAFVALLLVVLLLVVLPVVVLFAFDPQPASTTAAKAKQSITATTFFMCSPFEVYMKIVAGQGKIQSYASVKSMSALPA